MKSLVCLLFLATLCSPTSSTTKTADSFRVIPILKRENGYGNFASIAFTSKKDLDSFIASTATQMGWNNLREFQDALHNANVDFNKEALLLLRHDEGSGSIQVAFETPVVQDGKLICEIRGKAFPPGIGGTMDMAYYCFAVVVSKAAVTQVELRAVQGGFHERRLPTIVFPIAAKE